MADLGAIGHVQHARVAVFLPDEARAQASIVGSGATPGAWIAVCTRSASVAGARADAAGEWRLPNGLNDGTYWAAEVGSLRAWLVEVAGSTVTVTLQTGGSGGGETIVAAYAWAAIA